MKNYEQALGELNMRHEREREQLEREYVILKYFGTLDLTDGYKAPFVHHSNLYGSAGVIHFGLVQYESIDKGLKSPDAGLLRRLLDQYPPVPKVKVSNGCVSFRPDMGEAYSGKNYECHGVTVRINVFQTETATVEWFAKMPDGLLWRINVDFALNKTKFGRLDLRPRYYGGNSTGKISSYDVCKFYADNNAQVLTYASGGREYPNSFVLYWDRLSGDKIDFSSLAEGSN